MTNLLPAICYPQIQTLLPVLFFVVLQLQKKRLLIRPGSTKTPAPFCCPKCPEHLKASGISALGYPQPRDQFWSEPIPRLLPATLKGAHKKGPVCPERICKKTRVSMEVIVTSL